MTTEPTQESFDEFRKSFSYGSRSDLNFKFLSGLTTEEAATFFQELLWKLGDAGNDGDFGPVTDHIYEWQRCAYAGVTEWAYATGPFTPLGKPVSASRMALIASSGHFVAGDDPNPFGVVDMTQTEAQERISEFIRNEPSLSTIPMETPADRLRVRHGGYDIRSAETDPNAVFPYKILSEMAGEGLIGELLPDAYSFVGACAQKRLLNKTGPQWVRLLQEQGVDAALLVPV
jgi:hypothetical protein